MSRELTPYKPPPIPIPKNLLKKEELTLRERLWVWNDVLLGGIGAIILTIGLAWLFVPLTIQPVGQFLTLLGGSMVVASIATFLIRAFSNFVALNSAQDRGQLSHSERATLCLYDRNRRARIQRGEFVFAEKHYSIFPTYVDYFASGRKQVTLILFEHVRPDPYLLTYVLPRRFRFSQRVWLVKVPQGNESVRQVGVKPSREVVEAEFEKLEAIARGFEQMPHETKVNEFEAESMVLDLRRKAPSGKTEAIQKTRRMLNR